MIPKNWDAEDAVPRSAMCECGHAANQHTETVDGSGLDMQCTATGCTCHDLRPRIDTHGTRESAGQKHLFNIRIEDTPPEMVHHPSHYGGDTTYEHIKVVRAWGLDYWTGNATKYIARAGKKYPSKEVEDLEKAVWYLQNKIDNLKKG